METLDKLKLCAAYAREAGMECRLEPRSGEERPFDLLLLPEFLDAPDGGAPLALTAYFAPSRYALMDRMEYDLLHLMAPVGRVQRASAARELRAFLGEVNVQMPVGAFDVDEEGAVYLRYTLPVPREMDGAVFLRQFGIALSLLNAFAMTFVGAVFAIIRGERTAKTAMDLAREQLNTIYDALHQNGEDHHG